MLYSTIRASQCTLAHKTYKLLAYGLEPHKYSPNSQVPATNIMTIILSIHWLQIKSISSEP